ncbi:hypothetical protein [Brachybacterium sp. J153]|uniref:hypothetical protein n=1 Tax=Brachybacterium sp. J153 TaxID=3116488 RepID=UPI002E79AB49|nr:hypothetical protein [Brachybacterium sp. J153]MEE1617839.1 hypothetical protein [Brachybacterium sp. J153]
MQIQLLPDDGTGRTALLATPDPGDRPMPVDQLLLDAAPRMLDDECTAVAGTLLFAPYAQSEISFGKKISAGLAGAIQDATGLTVTSKTAERPRSDDAVSAPLQVTTLAVSLDGALEASTPGVDRTRLRLVPGERFQGALFGVKEAVIASNAWYLARVIDPHRVQLAAGLLFARDLLAQHVRTTSEEAEAWAVPEEVATLCAALGIGVS